MRYQPMYAKEALKPFQSPDYIYEPKWDGYRALFVTKERKIISRTGKDLTPSFSQILNTNIKDAVIDGELVVLHNDRPNFAYLRTHSENAVLMAFDLLLFNGEDMCNLPLEKRREILQAILINETWIGFSPSYVDGLKLFQALSASGWEGVMAKRRGSIYRPGKRTSDWLKIIAYKQIDAVVMDIYPNRGSVLLGLYKGKELLPIGRVSYHKTEDLKKDDQVVVVRYREFAKDSLRHASVMYLRDDKTARECTYDQLI